MTRKHTLPPKDLDLKKALHEERHLLEDAEVPIVTVSATFRKELAEKYHAIVHTPSDVVYSRGHYSMAEAVRQQALAMGKKVHMVDPTNFVSKDDWKKIEFTETIGLLVARHKLLKLLRDKVDTVLRGKLPISDAIKPPLFYLTERTKCPIVSMHYETGNVLAKKGKTIVQAITDPHVHRQYLDALPDLDSNEEIDITFAVFDEETKKDFFTLAKKLNKKVKKDQVIVTGPFVDPRIVVLSKNKKTLPSKGPINIAVTTGGLGTNFSEIKQVLDGIKTFLKDSDSIRLFLYAGTHRDFRDYFEDYAAENNLRIGNLDDEEARIRILHEDSMVDGNDNIIKYMFPWANIIVTKPSGDMAYDAAVAGCSLLFLEPWGSWEKEIQKRFVKMGIGYDLDVDNAYGQINKLLKKGNIADSLKKAHSLPQIYKEGCKNLLKIHSQKPCSVHP